MLNWLYFFRSIARGILTSLALFFITYGAILYDVNHDGISIDSHASMTYIISTSLVLIVNLQVWKVDIHIHKHSLVAPFIWLKVGSNINIVVIFCFNALINISQKIFGVYLLMKYKLVLRWSVVMRVKKLVAWCKLANTWQWTINLDLKKKSCYKRMEASHRARCKLWLVQCSYLSTWTK